ncbi:hypothetical protein ACHAWO_011129 [Cyclotella atomus]|jgi:solute carrier family 25 thiamine pyrophosphate transporter 19|uniref:Mitochondrial carrier protein n=1 Tax=Cyclotella atomus TaxID=382360 RepID=A0ABD3NSP6_9STRA
MKQKFLAGGESDSLSRDSARKAFTALSQSSTAVMQHGNSSQDQVVSSEVSHGQNQPTYPHWHDLLAGAAAGLGARCITAPLDLIKIRRQLQSSETSTSTISGNKSNIVSSSSSYVNGEWRLFQHLYSIAEKEGGIRSLFRGNVAASYLWMGYSVVQFWVYGYSSEYLRQYYNTLCMNGSIVKPECDFCNELRTTGIISFTSGAVAGICGTLVTYPFDLCRTIFAARGIYPIAASNVTWSERTTRLASESQRQYAERKAPKTLTDFSRQLYQQKGFQGFFAGSGPALLSIVPYMGLNFALHDILVSLNQDPSKDKTSKRSFISGIAGMGAGVISKFLVYPLDTVKKRLQAQAFWGGSKTESKSANYKSPVPQNRNAFSQRKLVGAVNVGTQKKQAPILYKGMVDCFKQVLAREGAAAFYKGLFPSLLKSSVSTGASFWLFTFSKNVLRSIHDSTRG